jgi:hypothetical protein
MKDAVEPVLLDATDDRCPRCLQPVPHKAPRCPGCGQPIRTMRMLPFAIGAAGLLALVFAVLLMYRVASNEDAANAPAPPDPAAAEKQQELFPRPTPTTSKASEPAKPEKPPPLNER